MACAEGGVLTWGRPLSARGGGSFEREGPFTHYTQIKRRVDVALVGATSALGSPLKWGSATSSH